MKMRDVIDAICLPEKFEDLARTCRCNRRYSKKKKLGQGKFGKVYQTCKVKGVVYAMKVQPFDEYAEVELRAYLDLKRTNVTPTLYAAWVCRNKLYLVMEKLFDCKRSHTDLVKRTQNRLDRMLERGWLHCDVHLGNIMCTATGRLVLIDFGLAAKKRMSFDNHSATFAQLKKRQQKQMKDLEEGSYEYYYSSDDES